MVFRNMNLDLNVPLGSEENVIEDTDVSTGDSENLTSDRLAVLENRLSPGSVFESVDSAYSLYSEYARLVGFSVRKGSQGYCGMGKEIRVKKKIVCHCEGRPDFNGSRDRFPSCKIQQQLRTGCQARLHMIWGPCRVEKFVKDPEGPWRVEEFVKDHNHELVDSDQSYLLRSARNLTQSKAFVTEAFQAASIYRNMEKDSEGVDNIGLEDAYDHMGRIKLYTRVSRDDADALYQYFSEKSQEPGFYWDGMMDCEGRLMNFFIRDARSALDYDCFGDVMFVDTTFNTNRGHYLCVTFEGINHHRCNVLFGIACMSNESTRSFKWLFSTFLKAMQGKEPEVIFSDQCQELIKGIDRCFGKASHRFCQWHVNQKASSHFGRLNNDQYFKRLWAQCMNGCETESEFDQLWETLIVGTYELRDIPWFNTLYNLKYRWSSVFTKNRFSAGMHAISRSESANSELKILCKYSSSLHEVVLHYETLLKEWRQRQRIEDKYSGTPNRSLKHNGILRHAATVYTRNVYTLFEDEFKQTVHVKITEKPSDISANELCFKMTDVPARMKVRTVCFNRADERADCACCKWETEGILCRHVLKVLHTLNISKLPERYIRRRWTRAARNRRPNNVVTPSGEDSGEELLYVDDIMRMVHSMAVDCKDSATLRATLNEGICGLYNQICGAGKVSPVLGKRTRNEPS